MPFYPDDKLPLAGGTMTGIITSTNINPLLTPAESWIGPSSTTGIYFKGGFVGLGTATPGYKFDLRGLNNLFNIMGTDTTTRVYGQVGNSDLSAALYYGAESSAGGEIFGGTLPKAAVLGTGNATALQFATNVNVVVTILPGGNTGFGLTAPTAVVHLKAGTASANTAPLKVDPGTVNTTPVSGCIESDGTHLYWVDSGNTRRQLDN